MTKIIYTLIRYALTAAGASEAIATDDVVMQIVSGIVAIGSVAWGIFEAKRHAQLAAASGKSDSSTPTSGAALLVVCAMLLPLAAAMTGCTTTASTASDGKTVSTASVDWTVVDFTIQKSSKYATAAVLEKHPEYSDDLAAVGAGLDSVVQGSPSETDIKTVIQSLAPGLDSESATAIASVLKDACDLYMAKSGKTSIVQTDETVQGVVKAIGEGIEEGIALNKSK